MTAKGHSLQFVLLAPVLVLMLIAGTILYFMVLRTVGEHVDANIRANLDSLARSAFAMADNKVDEQNFRGLAGDPMATRLYQVRTFKDFEDFARENDIGLIVFANDKIDFATGPGSVVANEIPGAAALMGQQRLELTSREYYVRPFQFAPWDWRIVLVKDASAFEMLVSEVRTVYISTAILLVLVTLMLTLWLRQVLVQPIFRIATEFGEGRAPGYEGVQELEFLSDSIGSMMQSLQEKTLHLETTFRSMSDGIAVFDADMRLVAWNPQYLQLYDYPPYLIRAGMSFADIMRFNVERGDYGEGDPEAQLAEIVDRARNLDPSRFEIDRVDGTSMEVRRAPMPDGGFVTTYTDVTERKQAEDAKIARREAEAANEAKSDFLRNMSHDLRKPANAIIEAVGLVLKKAGKTLPARQRQNLENARVSSIHLRQMIDEILEISRIEAGQVEVNPVQVRLKPLVESCLQIVEPIAKAKGLDLHTQLEPKLQAATDPMLLSRILVNLASNAAEYTEHGTITVAARGIGDNLEVSVTDTGIGIPPERLETIFEKFQQIEPSLGTVKPGMGLGLGLAISREFARLLGGVISVQSEPDAGSVFTVTIPIAFRETGICKHGHAS